MEHGMECGCSDDYCDLTDGPDVFDNSLVKARKEHWCYECNRTIENGEQYWNISGCWYGSWSHYKICRQCDAIARDYLCGCYYYGSLRSEIWCMLGVDIVTGEVSG